MRVAWAPDCQIGPLHHRMQIGCRRRTALSVAFLVVELGHLKKADTFGFAGIEIVADAVLHLCSCLDEGMADSTGTFLVRDL